MNCPNCGAALTGSPTTCSSCGRSLAPGGGGGTVDQIMSDTTQFAKSVAHHSGQAVRDVGHALKPMAQAAKPVVNDMKAAVKPAVNALRPAVHEMAAGAKQAAGDVRKKLRGKSS